MTGYDTPVGDIEFLRSEISRIDRLLGELTAPSSGQINKQLAALEAAQTTLTAQQAALSAQVAFLATQTTYAFNGNLLSGTRGASGGISLDSYSGTYDCEINLTSSSTGLLLVTVSAQVGSSEATALVGFEVLWSGGSIGVDYSRAATAGLSITTSARASLVTVPANTAVTIRSRRGWTGGTSATDWWAYSSLAVTRVGQ